MKNIICLSIIGILFFGKNAYSQSKTSNNFQVHVNYLNIKEKARGGKDLGFGIGAEYHLNLVKRIGLQGIGGIGYERLSGNCPLCESEWFQNGYWAGIGFSKTFILKEKHQFVGQIRYRFVGFERMEPELIDMDGTIVRWQEANTPQDLVGFRFGYFVPIKLPVIISYTFENGSFFRMNSVSLGFQF